MKCSQSKLILHYFSILCFQKCLNDILKNYDEYGTSTTKGQKPAEPNRIENMSSTENLLEQCDKIIAEVNKNIENLTKKNKSHAQNPKARDSSSRLRHEATRDSQKSSIGKHLEKNLFEFSDVIAETESLEPLPKKARTNTRAQNVTTPQADPQLCDELNDSFDEAELEKIDSPARNHSKIDKEVNSNYFPKNCSNNGRNDLINEDDLFSDDDVVDTTPQRNKKSSGVWYVYFCPFEALRNLFYKCGKI